MKTRIINFVIFIILLVSGLFFNYYENQLNATTIGPVLIVSSYCFLFFGLVNFNILDWISIENNAGDEREKLIQSLAKCKTFDMFVALIIPFYLLQATYEIVDIYTITIVFFISAITYKVAYNHYNTKY